MLIIILILNVGCYEETALVVNASFVTTLINEDASAPVQVYISNKTENADTFSWTFTGGTPENSTDKNPGTITYSKAGTYLIRLKASNVDGEEAFFEKEIKVLEGIDIQFSTEIIENNYPAARVKIKNSTAGDYLTYNWTFIGGIPESSNEKNPVDIVYETPGDHLIKVTVSNGLETFSKESIITVAPDILVDFDWEVDFKDDDYQAPVTITMLNNSVSVTSYQWEVSNGVPINSVDQTPTVTFNTPGTYTIKLIGDNGKKTATKTKEIIVYANTNVRLFTDVKLGINTAHSSNTIGAFFSTITRSVYTQDEVTLENGHLIDIPFFGFNKNFNVNKFVSPTQAQTTTFNAIPNAVYTKFINVQESCECNVSLSTEQFNSITEDTLLDNLVITDTPSGLEEFDNSLVPRVVLFETYTGRKGAIKIKEYVVDGTNSYIICDIKVQKE
ncbi:PKD domain-containing protein [Polaribacter sp. L3A8]|uniref:PKD domain-containing protein n=1 Tax=Polaribacter sp. L3A8 TaxID=2686361 RepID=UPI00131C4C13|nr:PKD domain-containing protein [Polaribacter sp. L3A8]